jgi:hypothetical protein
MNSYIAVSVDVLDEKSIDADTALIPQPNLHQRSSHSFFCIAVIIIERVKRSVELEPVPHKAAVDALWPWHPAIIDHLVEFCHANADILGGLDPRETARGKRERQSTDCLLSHCAAPAISRQLPPRWGSRVGYAPLLACRIRLTAAPSLDRSCYCCPAIPRVTSTVRRRLMSAAIRSRSGYRQRLRIATLGAQITAAEWIFEQPFVGVAECTRGDGETELECLFRNYPGRVTGADSRGVSCPREERGAENSRLLFLPIPLQFGVEFPAWSLAQRRDGSLGECPSRGRHKRVPHHMAGHPGEFDTKWSIRDAGADEHSRQLVDYALPRAGRETATVDFAFRKPLTAVIRTSGFVERAAMDHERICHGANPFQRPGDAGKRFRG